MSPKTYESLLTTHSSHRSLRIIQARTSGSIHLEEAKPANSHSLLILKFKTVFENLLEIVMSYLNTLLALIVHLAGRKTERI